MEWIFYIGLPLLAIMHCLIIDRLFKYDVTLSERCFALAEVCLKQEKRIMALEDRLHIVQCSINDERLFNTTKFHEMEKRIDHLDSKDDPYPN